MPFLRVIRDKRGYETTYLMHWFREGSRQRSRILYVFRTPPGVRIGRDPLDSTVARELEARHPDIEFDWRALRENRQIVETGPESRRPRTSRPTRGEAGHAGKRRPLEEPVVSPAAEPGRPAPEPEGASPPAFAAPGRRAVPGSIEGETREQQLAFLAKWHAELRDRIPHRTHDPVRLEALLNLAERLNPSSWSTEEQIAEGLQHASEALGRLSRVLSKRRRRPRRPRAAGPGAVPELAVNAQPTAAPSEPSVAAGPSERQEAHRPVDPPNE